jgi:hypothetical protein
MFRVKRSGENRVDLELYGKLDGEAMGQLLDNLVNASTDLRHGRLLFRLDAFDLPTLGAFAVELARLPQLLRLLHRFQRCAVLTDTAWLRTASEVEGALIPGLQVRAFRSDQELEAEDWLTEA